MPRLTWRRNEYTKLKQTMLLRTRANETNITRLGQNQQLTWVQKRSKNSREGSGSNNTSPKCPWKKKKCCEVIGSRCNNIVIHGVQQTREQVYDHGLSITSTPLLSIPHSCWINERTWCLAFTIWSWLWGCTNIPLAKFWFVHFQNEVRLELEQQW